MDRLGYTVLAVALLGITTTALPIPSSYISDPFPDLKGIQAHPSSGYPAPHRPVQDARGLSGYPVLRRRTTIEELVEHATPTAPGTPPGLQLRTIPL